MYDIFLISLICCLAEEQVSSENLITCEGFGKYLAHASEVLIRHICPRAQIKRYIANLYRLVDRDGTNASAMIQSRSLFIHHSLRNCVLFSEWKHPTHFRRLHTLAQKYAVFWLFSDVICMTR